MSCRFSLPRKKPPPIYIEIFTIILGSVIIGVGIWWLVTLFIEIFGSIFMIVIGALYILGGGGHLIQRKKREAKT